MALLNDILTWTESLPTWQRDACRRLFQKEAELDDADYSELYNILKTENGINIDDTSDPVPLTGDNLPIEVAYGEVVTLVALRNLENVNQIPSNSVLNFAEKGMTIIYGGNGSGKSGYARVMKRACRARDQSEPIHPNAHDPAAATKEPAAKFEVLISGTPKEVAWSRDSTPPECLSSISVFDAKCARSYVTEEQDVAFLPYGLDIVENLANQVLPRLSEMLELEIESIDVSKLPLDHLLGETEVGKVIEGLSFNSDTDEISSLSTFSEDDEQRLVKLEAALREANPLAKAEGVRLSGMRLKAYSEELTRPLNWVSLQAAEKLQKLDEEKTVAEQVEKKAADALRDGEELLPGTGGQEWKQLFEAAKRYSTTVAYPGEDFPYTITGKDCPLCQEKLPESALKRVKRFNDYIQNDVATTAEEARKRLETAKVKIRTAEIQITPDKPLGDELKSLDGSVLQSISDFQASINSRRDLMLECLETSKWDEIPVLIESPRNLVRDLAAQQLREFRTLVKVADEDKRIKLEKEQSELSARKSLSRSLKTVFELLDRMKIKAALEKCRPYLKTRLISDKSKEFAAIAVTDELRKTLDKEFNALEIGHIKTKLKKKSVRGKMYHQLLLDLPNVNKIEEVLSEGEQRAIALGSFFAELALSNHSCGIVFDDPVTSLDHWRRIYVARRLVNEAKRRQVIVFTHDTSFLGQLCDEIEAEKIQSSKSFLEWCGGLPGSVNDGLPWDHQGYKARINSLEQSQSKLAKAWPAYPSEAEIAAIRHEYGRLRATLERVIQDVVFNGVIKRYRDWIKVEKLKDVVGFDRSEYESIMKLHKRSCDVITGHDPASAKAAAVPTVTELGDDISALKTIVETIKNRRKG